LVSFASPHQGLGHVSGSAVDAAHQLHVVTAQAGLPGLDPPDLRLRPFQLLGCRLHRDPLAAAQLPRVPAELRGCRRAELCGFRWSFAGLDRGVLTVKRTVLQLSGELHEEPAAKSRAGDRLVFLDAETAGLLREHRSAQLAARLRGGQAWRDNDLVFSQPDGRPWNPDHVSKHLPKLAAQAGVPVIKLHEGGRHTGNSLMRDAGVDQELRMREVGHASKDINDRYTHALEEAHLAAAEQIAALVRRAGIGS
jgi:integrase